MKGRTVGVERIVSIMINMETLLLIAGTVQWYIQRAAQKLRWLGHFDGMEKSKEAQRYVPLSVFYDDQDEIWVVSFGEDSRQNTLGGDCSIAMQKKDGKVLRIWFGE